MLKIRLQRLGKIKQPIYRLIVSDNHKDTQSGSLEILGKYQPLGKTPVIDFNADRIKYWISVGAQTSPTVNNLLVTLGIITGKKQRSVAISQKRQAALDKKSAEKKSFDLAPADATAMADKQDKKEEAAKPAPVAPEAPAEVPAETPAA